MYIMRFNRFIGVGIIASIMAIFLAVNCSNNGGSGSSDAQAIYSVNFSSTATSTEVKEVDTNIETALGRVVYFDKVTSISYDLYIRVDGITDNEATLIENELNAHAHVCEYCRYSNGCPTVVLSKVACP
ncbi:MAG: hypothetical protein ABUK01_06425 [Leptospirales bacterium]